MRRIVLLALPLLLLATNVSADEILAKVGDREITRSELEKSIRGELIALDNQKFELMEGALDRIIAEELIEMEAKSRDITMEELQEAEITSKLTAPSEEEINALYEQAKGELGGQTLEEIKPRLIAYLQTQQAGAKGQEFLAGLRKKYSPTVNLKPPVVEIGTGGRPSRGGGDDAPITIVGFSDYECPFCRKGEDSIEAVLEEYGDKVRYFHRDFPLSFHANAHRASQAARCAQDQGKFWEYHTALFESSKINKKRMNAIADELELDRAKFDECLEKETHKAAVDKDMAEGAEVGISGTPAFFVNGRMLSGAQPVEAFKRIIDAELAR